MTISIATNAVWATIPPQMSKSQTRLLQPSQPMSTSKKAKTMASKNETKPSHAKHGNLNAAGSSPEHEKQSLESMYDSDMGDPEPEFVKYDVNFRWNVTVIAGEDRKLGHFKGSDTINRMLAPENLALAPQRAYDEIVEKVARPIAGLMQYEANRVAQNDPDSL